MIVGIIIYIYMYIYIYIIILLILVINASKNVFCFLMMNYVLSVH